MAGEVVSAPAATPGAGHARDAATGLELRQLRRLPRGRDNLCARYDVLGYRSNGGYAELVTVPAANLLPIPDTLGFVQAAAFPLTFLTVWHMLVARARVQAGEWVLVLAAGSGVGQAAIQVARLHGARVIATAGTAAKRQHAQELGATAALDHYAPAMADEVRAAHRRARRGHRRRARRRSDLGRSIRALARGGRLVTCGATTGPNGQLDLRASVRAADLAARLLHGVQGRAGAAPRRSCSPAASRP